MYMIRLHLGNILNQFLKKCVKRIKVIYGVLKPGSVRNLVLPYVPRQKHDNPMLKLAEHTQSNEGCLLNGHLYIMLFTFINKGSHNMLNFPFWKRVVCFSVHLHFWLQLLVHKFLYTPNFLTGNSISLRLFYASRHVRMPATHPKHTFFNSIH